MVKYDDWEMQKRLMSIAKLLLLAPTLKAHDYCEICNNKQVSSLSTSPPPTGRSTIQQSKGQRLRAICGQHTILVSEVDLDDVGTGRGWCYAMMGKCKSG